MKIDVVEEFMALASLNSPSRREALVADYLLKRLGELGLTAMVDDSAPLSGSDTGNIIVRVPGNAPGPTVLLCAHMDTVGPTEGMVPVLRDGVIYSNGETVLGADDKAGIAIILAVLAELQAGDVPHRIIEVVFTVQEEVGLFGVKLSDAAVEGRFRLHPRRRRPRGQHRQPGALQGGSRFRAGGEGGPCGGLPREGDQRHRHRGHGHRPSPHRPHRRADHLERRGDQRGEGPEHRSRPGGGGRRGPEHRCGQAGAGGSGGPGCL